MHNPINSTIQTSKTRFLFSFRSIKRAKLLYSHRGFHEIGYE
jgi:hypothetical protein